MVEFTLWQNFEKLTLKPIDNDCIEKIIINRNEFFQITIDIDCIIPDTINLPNNNLLKELIPDLKEIRCFNIDKPYYEYCLNGIIIKTQTFRQLPQISFHGEIVSIEEEIKSKAMGNMDFSTYWILNNYDRMGYTRGLTIQHHEETKIESKGFFEDNFNNIMENIPSYVGSDLIPLKYGKYSFMYGAVNKDLSGNTPACYLRFLNSELPDDNEINDIISVLSYLTGVELLLIGMTKYNKVSSPIFQKYYSIFKINLKEILEREAVPPIPISIDFTIQSQKLDIESYINQFLESYRSNKDKYQLNKIFWYIQNSLEQNIINMIQPLSTAYDLLCNLYLDKKKSVKLIDESKFNCILDKIIPEVETCLKDEKNKDKIINKIKVSNNISGNLKNTLIFELLNMELSSLEKNAIKERNSVIHGSKKDLNYPRRILRSKAFYTLVNRIILSVLELNIPYLDYSVDSLSLDMPPKKQKGEENS